MRILVSGAGIAGPTLAWFLAKVDTHITIVEKSPDLLDQGQNIDIDGSAITVIQKMGLLEQIKRFNTTEKGTQFIDPNGRPFAPFPVKGGSPSPTSELEILRGDLARVFYEATKDYPNVKYLFGTTIQTVISNSNDVVKVELSSGEVQEFDVIVAADGQWSRVRRQCFPPESVTPVDKGMFVAYYTVPRLPSDNDWWNIYQGLGSRTIALRPDPYGTTRAMLSLMPCSAAQKQEWHEASRSDKQTQQKLLRKEFADAGWQAQRLLDAMDEASDFYFQQIQQIKMSKWSSSRIVCVGDAAYAPTPLTGMGTSLAIVGAYTLAGELSKLNDEEHPSKAFDEYERILRPWVEKIQYIPFFVPGIAHPRTSWQRWLLRTLLKVIAKVVTSPLLANRFDKSDESDFALPQYSCFESKGSK